MLCIKGHGQADGCVGHEATRRGNVELLDSWISIVLGDAQKFERGARDRQRHHGFANEFLHVSKYELMDAAVSFLLCDGVDTTPFVDGHPLALDPRWRFVQGVDRPSNDTGRLLVKTAANLGLRAEWDASNEETRKRAAQATAQGCFEEAERLSTFDKSWARIRDLSYNTHQHPHPHKTTTQHTCMRASLELTLVLPSNVQSQNRFFSASAHSETVIFCSCRERLLAALAANFMRMCDEGSVNCSAMLVLQRLYGGTDTEKAELLRAAAQVRTEEMQEETTAEAGHQARFSVVDVKDALGRTPLQLAVETQQPVIVATLLAAGASAEARDHDGNTVLMAAVFKGNAECVKALLRFKGFDRHTLTHKRSLQPDIEARGAHGRTALIFAARPVVCSLTHSLKIISLQYVPWVEHHTLPSRVSMYHAPCVYKP